MSQLILDGHKQSVTTIVTYNDESGNLSVLFGRSDPRYQDRIGESLTGMELPVGAAQFIGGQVEGHIEDADLTRLSALLPNLDSQASGMDYSILANALKELSEEAGLEAQEHIQSDGVLRLAETITREDKLGSVQDIHYLNLHLGTLTPDQIVHLQQSVCPGDDMIQTIIVPLSNLKIDDRNEIHFHGDDGFAKTKTDFDGFPEMDMWNELYDAAITSLEDSDMEKVAALQNEQANYNAMHTQLRGLDGVDQQTLSGSYDTTLYMSENPVIRSDSAIFQSFLKTYFGTVLPTPSLNDVRELMRNVAAEHIVPFAGDKSRASSKDGGSVVTESDVAAQNALTIALVQMFPGAKVTGEENGGSATDLTGEGIEFVIDPVDGTREFVEGGPRYCEMLSKELDGQPVASWIYFPVTNEMVFALKGRGIFVDDGKMVKKLDISELPKAQTEMVFVNGATKKFAADSAQIEALRHVFNKVAPSAHIAGYDFKQMITGQTHALIYGNAKFNDILPWRCFLGEMGYAISDLHGAPYDPTKPQNGVIVAPNVQILEAIARHLQ